MAKSGRYHNLEKLDVVTGRARVDADFTFVGDTSFNFNDKEFNDLTTSINSELMKQQSNIDHQNTNNSYWIKSYSKKLYQHMNTKVFKEHITKLKTLMVKEVDEDNGKGKGIGIAEKNERLAKMIYNSEEERQAYQCHGILSSDGRRIQKEYETSYYNLQKIFNSSKTNICNIIQAIKNLFPNHFVSGLSLLYSEPNCPKQFYHYDYFQRKIGQNVFMSYSVIIPLENKGLIHMVTSNENVGKETKQDVELNIGDILIFSGNQKHAGAAYNSSRYPNGNLRLFFYLYHYLWPPVKDSIHF